MHCLGRTHNRIEKKWLDKDANSKVAFHIESKGPPQKTLLEFYVSPKPDNTSTVILYFHNEFPWMVHLAVRLFGIARWTRGMHVKDLNGSKRYVENNETYEGQPLGQTKAA